MSKKSYSKIPATIVTGFLGSGKTSLLKNMLENADGRRIAVIVNEFGELGIDGDILKSCGLGCEDENGENGSLYELANGCLCCTVQEEFYPVMKKLMDRRQDIDHILIETSGLALPKPLVQAFNWPEIKNACTVDAVITVVDTPAVAAGQFATNPDAVEVQRQADENLDHESSLLELFEDQLSAADLVILSKTDLIDTATIEMVSAQVSQRIPEQVKQIYSDANGLDLGLVLGLDRSAEQNIHLRHSHHEHHHSKDSHTHNHNHNHGHVHSNEHEHDHSHDQFDSVVVKLPEVEKATLLNALQHLVLEKTIYRIKGFVAVPNKPMRLVVHGVGKRFDSYFDRRWDVDEMPSTHLVLIGKELEQEQLQQYLTSQTVADGAGVA